MPPAPPPAVEIDIPEVKSELEAVFARYEAALVTNDVATLDALFFDAPSTVRYGENENLYGFTEIAAFRARRSPLFLGRRLERTVITTFGRDYGVASTLYRRESATGRLGRQSQTWVRFPDGWKIVAAHVSAIDDREAPRG